MEQLEEILRDRDNVIEELEKQLGGEVMPKAEPAIRQKILYRPVKGDLVDELMAVYVNKMKAQLPVKRLGDGYYLFGTKKIFAKIMNGKLVNRVGGGYMSVDEFIEAYSNQEVAKVQMMIDKGTFNLDEYGNGSSLTFDQSPASKHAIP